jgi:hypothetical protein
VKAPFSFILRATIGIISLWPRAALGTKTAMAPPGMGIRTLGAPTPVSSGSEASGDIGGRALGGDGSAGDRLSPTAALGTGAAVALAVW